LAHINDYNVFTTPNDIAPARIDWIGYFADSLRRREQATRQNSAVIPESEASATGLNLQPFQSSAKSPGAAPGYASTSHDTKSKALVTGVNLQAPQSSAKSPIAAHGHASTSHNLHFSNQKIYSLVTLETRLVGQETS
jgi:hypothetical protein